MKYNDHLVLIENGKEQIAKFIAFRPDKDTVVFERRNGFHELPSDKVRKATHEEVTYWYGGKIAKLRNEIKGNENMIAELRRQLEGQRGTLKNRELAVIELADDEEKLMTCLLLAGKTETKATREVDGFENVRQELNVTKRNLKAKRNEATNILRKIEAKETEIERRQELIQKANDAIKEIEKTRDQYLEQYRLES